VLVERTHAMAAERDGSQSIPEYLRITGPHESVVDIEGRRNVDGASSSLTYCRNSKTAANLPSEIVWDFGVAGNGFNGAVGWIRPQGM
jgi:hypothetical protein